MDLDVLRTFAAVAESASFTAAAEKLRIPKSSVSRQVARLENALGTELFRRTTRKVSLSPAGVALYERSAPLVTSLHAVLSSLPVAEEEPSGLLRVTAPNDLGAGVVAELAARFVARYPAVKLDFVLTVRFVDLLAEGFDVALRAAASLSDSSLVARKVGSAEIGIFAAPAYLAKKGSPRSPRDLIEHPWVIFSPMSKPLRLVGPGPSATLKLEGRIHCDDFVFVREAVRAGAGLGLLPVFLASEAVAAGQLTRVLPRWSTPKGQLYFVHANTRHVPRRITAFRDFVLETFQAWGSTSPRLGKLG